MTGLIEMNLEAEQAAAVPHEVLTFSLGNEHYAVDIQQVQEIRRYESPVRLANASPSLRGVLNLRGNIVPVIDLRLHLAAPAELTTATVTIVLNIAGQVYGAVVDAVADVVALSASDIKPPPHLATAGADFVEGIATLPSQGGSPARTVQLLSLTRLFERFITPTARLAAQL